MCVCFMKEEKHEFIYINEYIFIVNTEFVSKQTTRMRRKCLEGDP